MSLGRQAAQGAAWNYASFLASKGILFLATLLLARLLSPAEFGLVGMALLVITAFDIVREFGVGAALIQRQKDGQPFVDLAFLLSTSLGAVLFVLNWFLAPFITGFFETPSSEQAELLVWIVRVLGLTLLFASLGSTQDALLQKQLDYRKRMIPGVARTAVKGFISVGLALMGWGVWSLVLGQVLGEAAATALLWGVSPWRPTFKPDFSQLRSITSFSVQIMIVGALGWLVDDVDYLIIGRLYGDYSLGIYTLAFRIPELIIRNLTQSVSAVAFPVASRLQDDLAALRDAYLRMQHYMLLIVAPLGLGLAAVTPAVVRLLFGSKWEAAIPVMELLCIYMVLGGLGHWPGVIYKAIGRPDILYKLSLLKLAMLVPVLWWAAANYGIVGVGWGQVAVRCVSVLIDMAVAARFVGVDLFVNLRAIWPPIAAAAIMALGVRALYLLDPSHTNPLVLGLSILAGSAVYVAFAWVLDRQMFSELVSLGRGIVRRSERAATLSG